MFEGKTLLEHQIESLAANGIDEVVVVTGFVQKVEILMPDPKGFCYFHQYGPMGM